MSIILTSLILAGTLQNPTSIRLTGPQTITSSVRIVRGTYNVPTPSPYNEKTDASIRIVGDNITVDFQGATLQGTPQKTEPSDRAGTGIYVSGKNVTILNANVRGYKIAFQARNSPGLKILNCDFSYNWKQHLLSTLDREDESDWMSYHHNENDEWLRYGAGIYLRKCDNFEVKGTTIQGGQCGLMLMECNKGKAWNNDFSFLSGIGVGLYQSSDNTIMHNKIDWCVRGYSDGVYNRGQDSAGILIYEQSNRNTFAYNSVTHGGDGFFLWAGQTTMDSGEGGCNDNLLYGNDFSHAPTNGIEATFSRNKFVNNRVEECWHGVWGGYSYDSIITGNSFGRNEVGIAVEHGQHNTISYNQFDGDKVAIQLWMNKSQDPNWGYPKHHDTKSHDWSILGNAIFGQNVVFSIRDTTDVRIDKNFLVGGTKLFDLQGSNPGLKFDNNRRLGAKEEPADVQMTGNEWSQAPTQTMSSTWQPNYSGWSKIKDIGGVNDEARKAVQKYEPKPLEGGMWPFLKEDALRGRKYILIDQWGPYDFKSPILWPRGMTGNDKSAYKFAILGPEGHWRLVKAEGAKASNDEGTVPGSIELTLPPGKAVNLNLVLEYTGEATTNYLGVKTSAGKPVQFSYRQFFAPIDWTIKFFKWKDAENPSDVHSAPKETSFQNIIAGKPLKELKSDRLDYAGYAFDPVTGNDHYATVAEGDFEIPSGTYTIELTTDDGARVWLDGKQLISDAWKYQGPTAYKREVKLGGKHHMRVEHFQIDGYATLKLNLRPKS